MTNPQVTDALKPCPFCGTSGEDLMLFCDPEEARDNSGPSRRVQCGGCHIEAPYYDTEAEAITAWNTRALSAPAQEPVAWAKALADEIAKCGPDLLRGHNRAELTHLIERFATPPAPVDERRLIVAFLRHPDRGGAGMSPMAHAYAKQIERGEHLPAQEQQGADIDNLVHRSMERDFELKDVPTPNTVEDGLFAQVWQQAQKNHEEHSATDSNANDLRFFSLGLAGEGAEVLEAAMLVAMRTGKLADKVKKRWRDGPDNEALRAECSDVFAYNIMLAWKLGLTPETLLHEVARKQQVFVEKMAALSTQGCEHD